MADYNPVTENLSDTVLRAVLLLASCIGLAFWFRPQYSLSMYPIRTQAQIIRLSEESVMYKFYAPSSDKTYFFRRNILLPQAKKLKGQKTIEVVYSASNPDYITIPSLERPLPVWVFALVHTIVFFSFILTLINLVKKFRGSPVS